MDPFSDQYTSITIQEPELTVRKLVLQYLLHNCYGDSAKAFLSDISGMQPPVDTANGNAKKHNGLYTTMHVEKTSASTNDLTAAGFSFTSSATDSMDVDRSSRTPVEQDVEMEGTQDAAHGTGDAAQGDRSNSLSLAVSAPTPGHGRLEENGLFVAIAPMLNENSVGNSNGHQLDWEGLRELAEKGSRKNEELLPGHWESLEVRKQIYQAITTGSVSTALSLLSSHYPALLSADPSSPLTTSQSIAITFKLQCQQFIETVRCGMPMEALGFAQSTLIRFPQLDPKMEQRYTELLTDVTALIAYTKPENSPVGWLLGQEYREKVAEEVNSAVLALCGLRQLSTIERIVKQATVVRDIYAVEKDKRINAKSNTTPRWQLSTFLAETSPNTTSTG